MPDDLTNQQLANKLDAVMGIEGDPVVREIREAAKRLRELSPDLPKQPSVAEQIAALIWPRGGLERAVEESLDEIRAILCEAPETKTDKSAASENQERRCGFCAGGEKTVGGLIMGLCDKDGICFRCVGTCLSVVLHTYDESMKEKREKEKRESSMTATDNKAPPEDDGWIFHFGGKNPAPRQKVDVKLRNGVIRLNEYSDGLAWIHCAGNFDVVEWKLSP